MTTHGELLDAFASVLLPANDPDRLAYEFLAKHPGRLQDDVAALGIVVEEGPDFGERLFQAIRDHFTKEV